MIAVLKLFLDSLLGSLASAFLDWTKDRDRIATHESLGRTQAEDAQKGAVIDAVLERKKIDDAVDRMSDGDVLAELRKWTKPAAGH